MDHQDTRGHAVLTALLVSPDRALAEQFAATIPETRAFQILADLKSYPTRNALDIRLRQLRPDVLLLDVASDQNAAWELIPSGTAQKPPVQVVALHRVNDSSTVVSALRAGACDFLAAPFAVAGQREAIARLRRMCQPQTPASTQLGKVIVFAPAKPGSGSSTLATHIAHAIRREQSRRVLLLDLDLEGGTAGFYLKLGPSGSILDVVEQAGSMDSSALAQWVGNSAGVDVLLAPEQPYSEILDAARFHEALEFMRSAYDWIIVDGPSVFHRHSLMAISESDSTCLVTTSDLASLHLARRAKSLLTQLGLSSESCSVIVNRMSRKDGIAQEDIQKVFSGPVFGFVPNDYFSVHRAISLGQPLLSDCDLGRAIATLAARMTEPAVKPGLKTAKTAEPRPALARA
jgi:pilus assembly protein CpaE